MTCGHKWVPVEGPPALNQILVINAGSSSIKLCCFDGKLNRLVSGAATEIGGASTITVGERSRNLALPEHGTALEALLEDLAPTGFHFSGLAAAGHRIVHGGAALTAPCRLTPEIMAVIGDHSALASLHNPRSLAAINTLRKLAPDLRQTASFDTAFHAGNPRVASEYAIPKELTRNGIRRYGFHGISCCGLVAALPGLTGQPLPQRLLILHLGNGSSLTAVRDGHSVATSMGYSPVSGLAMGSRSGDIDANAVLAMAAEHGIAETGHILNEQSGLRALGGFSDMRTLHATDTPSSRFAVDYYCYQVIRHAGSMIAAMGGLDAIAFTAGIGENDAVVRGRIMDGLNWAGLRPDPDANLSHAPRLHARNSAIKAWIVAADEERTIAGHTLNLISGSD